METRFGLTEATIGLICAVLAKFPEVEQAILYGSRAKGNFRTGSDIDLVLVGDRLTTTTLYKIIQGIDDLLMPYTFDIARLDDITDPDILAHIRRVGVTFYMSEFVVMTSAVA